MAPQVLVSYGRKVVREIPPQGGGEMIATVTFEKTTYADLHKFEAGTLILMALCQHRSDYVNDLGLDNIAQYENELLKYGHEQLSQFENMRFIGEAENKASVISFLLGDIHPYDAGSILDKLGIAVRTGHHCTQPIMNHYNIPGTVRASFSFYNTKEEIDRLVEGLKKVEAMLS